MSYATGLLAAYPSSYGTSTLLSDNLVTRSSFENPYQSSLPYRNNDRLLNNDLAFNQFNHDTETYRPPLYSLSNSTSVYPTKNYPNTSVPNWRKPVPPTDSFNSLNDITEYSESLATASNTNTASSVAHSINDNHIIAPMKMFLNEEQNYTRIVTNLNNNNNNNKLFQSVWSSPPTKKQEQLDEIKKNPIRKHLEQPTKAQPTISTHKESFPDKLQDDTTPIQSPQPPIVLVKQQNMQHNPSAIEMKKQPPSIDVQAWINDTKKGSPIDEKLAEQAWSVKIDQLHRTQAQLEKEKTKSSRALPSVPKKVDSKPIVSKKKTQNDTKTPNTTHQVQHDSYFDSLFDGDYFRKPLRNDYILSSSIRYPVSTKSKLSDSLNNANSSILSKNPRHPQQRKTTRYEPPTIKRVQPTITTTSWRKQWPRQYHYDSIYPYYLYDEWTYRDFIHKDTDERFREALQKLRADRAEQQQKGINETTAKRMHYGDYVRHSTRDELLQNAVKPSPWSDFMDMKKGNIYSLSQEEKKRLYRQSKSYGERVRYRNFAIRYGAETVRSNYYSDYLSDDSQESESGNRTSRQVNNNHGSKSVSRVSKRPNSASTSKKSNKNYAKQGGARISNGTIPKQNSRTTVRTDYLSEDEYDDIRSHNTNQQYRQKPKKKNVRYAKFDSSGRVTSSTEDSETEVTKYGQRNTRAKNRDVDDDLFTVREEKTLESLEHTQYKKQ